MLLSFVRVHSLVLCWVISLTPIPEHVASTLHRKRAATKKTGQIYILLIERGGFQEVRDFIFLKPRVWGISSIQGKTPVLLLSYAVAPDLLVLTNSIYVFPPCALLKVSALLHYNL